MCKLNKMKFEDKNTDKIHINTDVSTINTFQIII